MHKLGALASDVDRMRAIGNAGLDVLLAEPRANPMLVAAVGYCFGGTMVLELGRGGAALRAIVGFHPGLGTTRPEDARNITGKVLMCVGTEDPFIPLEQRLAFEDEMRAGGVDWRMNLYGGAEHSFTHRWSELAEIPGVKYDELTDQRSWRAMTDLFDEVFVDVLRDRAARRADRQARRLADLSDCEQHAGHERRPVVGVVPDRQALRGLVPNSTS